MQNYLKSAKSFVIGSVAEAKKVTWPTRKQLFEYSVIVLGALGVGLLAMAAFDYSFSYLVQHYILGV
jgi:preprotein translocase SecE subunit